MFSLIRILDVLQEPQASGAAWRKAAQRVMALPAPKDFPVNAEEENKWSGGKM